MVILYAFNGCIVNTSTISRTITVSVPPVATLVSNSTPSLTVCAGESVSFTAGPSGSGETYQFKKGGSAASASEVSSNIYTTAITGHSSITVLVTNAAGCTSSRTIFVEVPLLASGGTITAPGDLTLCPGVALPSINSNAAATLDNSGTPFGSPGQALSYQWQTRTGSVWQDIDGATTAGYVASAAPVFLNATTEVRRLAFASINGVICPTGGTPAAANITFLVDTDRLPIITVNDADNTVCVSDITTLEFSVSTTGSTTGDTYVWKKNGTAIGGGSSTSWKYTPQAGDFVNGDLISITVNSLPHLVVLILCCRNYH